MRTNTLVAQVSPEQRGKPLHSIWGSQQIIQAFRDSVREKSILKKNDSFLES